MKNQQLENFTFNSAVLRTMMKRIFLNTCPLIPLQLTNIILLRGLLFGLFLFISLIKEKIILFLAQLLWDQAVVIMHADLSICTPRLLFYQEHILHFSRMR